jgi:hypothetical protein
MADAEHSKCFSERSAGSSPAFGTQIEKDPRISPGVFFLCSV